jgi:hypothetical protein
MAAAGYACVALYVNACRSVRLVGDGCSGARSRCRCRPVAVLALKVMVVVVHARVVGEGL